MATGQGRDGRPPIEEIAQALGISKTTVSRALSGKGRVSKDIPLRQVQGYQVILRESTK